MKQWCFIYFGVFWEGGIRNEFCKQLKFPPITGETCQFFLKTSEVRDLLSHFKN